MHLQTGTPPRLLKLSQNSQLLAKYFTRGYYGTREYDKTIIKWNWDTKEPMLTAWRTTSKRSSANGSIEPEE